MYFDPGKASSYSKKKKNPVLSITGVALCKRGSFWGDVGHTWQCSGLLPAGLRKLYVVSGIELRLAVCRTSALPKVLSENNTFRSLSEWTVRLLSNKINFI